MKSVITGSEGSLQLGCSDGQEMVSRMLRFSYFPLLPSYLEGIGSFIFRTVISVRALSQTNTLSGVSPR